MALPTYFGLLPLLVVMPSALLAQLKPEAPTALRIAQDPVSVEAREAGILKKGFARCIYLGSPAAAAAVLLNSNPLGTDFDAANIAANIKDPSGTFDMNDCLGEQAGPQQSKLGFKFKSNMLRALLAEKACLTGHRVASLTPASVLSFGADALWTRFSRLQAPALAATMRR